MELRPLKQIITMGSNTKINNLVLQFCRGSEKSFGILSEEYPSINSLVLVRIMDDIAYGETYNIFIGKITSLNHSYCEIRSQYMVRDAGGKHPLPGIETWENLKVPWSGVFPILIKSYTLEALGFEPYDIRGFKGYRLKTSYGFLKVRKQSSYWDDDKVEDPIWEFVYGKIIYQGRYIHELIDFIKHLGINFKIKNYE